jgi:hypothetical protein
MCGAKEVEVPMCHSRVQQGNLQHVLSSEVRWTLNFPLVYPAHEKNHKLMSKLDNFAVKDTTHMSKL